MFTKSAGELLDHWFTSDPLKAVPGWDSVVGNFASPYTPGSAYVMLHSRLRRSERQDRAWGHAIGGMGAISDAIAAECRARGVALETQAAVEEVLVDGGRARGVRLQDGRVLRARTVVANVHPKLLYQRLVPRAALDDDTAERIERHRNGHARVRCSARQLPRRAAGAEPVRRGHDPGGGVSGLPGRNAAREILRDVRRGPRPEVTG